MILKNTLNVLRDPDPPGQGSGGQPAAPQQAQPSQGQSNAAVSSGGLSPDQQKIAAAIDKANASAPPDKGPKQPKIHKSIFTAPSNAVLEQDFSLGDDAPIVEGEDRPSVKVEDTTKQNIDQQPPVKPAVKPQPQQPPQQKPAAQQQPPAKPGTQQVKVADAKSGAFDYSAFSPEETVVLKQMSNQAREFAAKTLKELKELRNQKPDVYYQHQDAYLLDPQYKELNTTIDYAAKEADHWKQQLLAIRQGKPWMLLEGFDDKGNPITKGPFKATDEADINVANALQVVSAQVAQMQNQRAGYGQQYQQRVKQDNAVLEAERQARFEWVKDPAKLEEKVDIGNGTQVSIKQLRDDFKNLFARYHHGNPVLEVAADMFTALQIYGARIRELEGNNQRQERITQDVLASEPNMETERGSGTPEKTDFDMAGLPD